MEKINIYVPEKTGAMLLNDAAMFEVLKRDGKAVNKNRFLSLLITGYYKDYVTEAKTIYESILSSIESNRLSFGDKEKIAQSILKNVVMPEVPPRKGKHPVRLSLKPTKDTEPLLEQILFDLGGEDYISQYFCRMFMSYCEKPFSKREQIVFNQNYETLLMACKTKTTIIFKTIWNVKQIHEVIPYKVVTGPEEMYNYLLCAEDDPYTGQQEAKAYRLNRINRINYGKNIGSIDNTVKRHLEMMIRYGPQYMINDDEETCVRLSENGLKTFNRVYYGRPIVERLEKREDYTYLYFKVSKDQLYLYFRRFSGNDAIIVYPKWLRDKMVRFHKESLYEYQMEGFEDDQR